MTAIDCEVFIGCALCNAFISNWSYLENQYFCVNCIDEVIE